MQDMSEAVCWHHSFILLCVSCAKLASLHLHLACQCGYCHIVFSVFSPRVHFFLDCLRKSFSQPSRLSPFSSSSFFSLLPLLLLTSSSAPAQPSSLPHTSHSIAVLSLFLLLRSAPLSLVPPTLTVKRKSAQEDVCVLQILTRKFLAQWRRWQAQPRFNPNKSVFAPRFLLPLLFLLLRPAQLPAAGCPLVSLSLLVMSSHVFWFSFFVPP